MKYWHLMLLIIYVSGCVVSFFVEAYNDFQQESIPTLRKIVFWPINFAYHFLGLDDY